MNKLYKWKVIYEDGPELFICIGYAVDKSESSVLEYLKCNYGPGVIPCYNGRYFTYSIEESELSSKLNLNNIENPQYEELYNESYNPK